MGDTFIRCPTKVSSVKNRNFYDIDFVYVPAVYVLFSSENEVTIMWDRYKMVMNNKFTNSAPPDFQNKIILQA